MKTYTPEEKKKYSADLRNRWSSIKKSLVAGEIDEIKAIIASHGLNVSAYSYAFTRAAMRAKGLDGIPYLDCKTFNGWKSAGFKVIKGQHSAIKGITWVGIGKKDEEGESTAVFPKEYHLFHKTQVEALAA